MMNRMHWTKPKLALVAVVTGTSCAWAAVEKNITVTDTREVLVGDAETQVDVASGGFATISPSPYAPTVRAQAGGTVRFDNPTVYDDETVTNAPWASKVGLWLDGSLVSSFEYDSNKSLTPGGVEKSFAKDCMPFRRWFDRRDVNHDFKWRGYNNRGISKDLSRDNGYNSVMPYTVNADDPAKLPNGRPYISLDICKSYGRRLPFIMLDDAGNELHGAIARDPSSSSDAGGQAPPNAMPAKHVVMVFGSQNGGGASVIAGGDSLGRLGNSTVDNQVLENPIFKTRHETRLDGSSTDPTQKNLLNGGWQVISFAVAEGDTVNGLGFNGFGGTAGYGGQNYAEVMVFTNAPTAKEIVDAELYLANKWGVTVTASSNAARLYGAGTVELTGATLKLGGEFSGTLTVPAGSTVELVDTRLAPTNPAAIPAGTEDALWFDTSRRDLTTLNGGADDLCDRLGKLTNLVKPGWYPLCGGGRGAGLVDAARGWGPTLCWYDYRKSLTSYDGNTSRFKDTYSGTGNTFDAKTVFMVLDTGKGGGTPILDTSVTSPVYLSRRAKSSSPIYVPNAGYAFVTNSPCYLNGVPVKSGERGFNGRGELLSTVFSETIPVKCIASYLESNDTFEMRHGEVLFYKDALTDAQRRDTEAYLMNKWLGITPAGYGDPSAMTIAGSGAVKLANHASAKPQFATAFAGTVGAATGELSFTVTAGTETAVVDPLALGGGTFDAGEALTVDVTLGGKVAPGRYLLIDAAAWAGAEPTLGTVVKPVSPKRTCTLVRDNGHLYLNVEADGLMLIFR